MLFFQKADLLLNTGQRWFLLQIICEIECQWQIETLPLIKAKLVFNVNLATSVGLVNEDIHKTENIKRNRENLMIKQHQESLMIMKEIISIKCLCQMKESYVFQRLIELIIHHLLLAHLTAHLLFAHLLVLHICLGPQVHKKTPINANKLIQIMIFLSDLTTSFLQQSFYL